MKQQGYFWDGKDWIFQGTISQGEGSSDNKTLNEKSKDYWDPIKGAKERVKASMENETNPYFGIKKAVLPAAAGAFVASGITGIPILLKSAMTSPHGVSNLLTNMAIQTGVGTAGSYVGETIDKNLGGTGEIGSFVGSLGTLWGVNKKIPFMKNFNTAITTPYNKDRSGVKWYVTNEDGNNILYNFRRTPNDKVVFMSTNPSEKVMQLNWEGKNATEIHLGGPGVGIPDKSDIIYAGRLFKKLPPGTYITPDATATSQTQRIQANGVIKELLTKTISEPLFNPPTVDGYATALKMGKNHRIDWADNTYLTKFLDSFGKTDNKMLYDAYHNFMSDKSEANLKLLNDALVNMGGKPAKFVNGELQIPFPLIHKLY